MIRKHFFASAALALALLLGGCFAEKPLQPSSPPETFQPADPPELYETMEYQYKTDVSASVTWLVTELDPDYLLLANKTHPLGSTYAPEETVTLTCPTYGGKEVELERRTAEALYAMLSEMAADGVTDVYVTSGYRTYAYQQKLYRQYLNLEKSKISEDAYTCLGEEYIKATYLDQGKDRLSEEDAVRVVLSYSALPGTSEHQSGLCVDFVTSTAMLTQAFERTEAFEWLSANAYRFGFILRYPSHKTEITGYSYEPWHYRFVGREAATEIYLRDLTLEEFLGEA